MKQLLFFILLQILSVCSFADTIVLSGRESRIDLRPRLKAFKNTEGIQKELILNGDADAQFSKLVTTEKIESSRWYWVQLEFINSSGKELEYVFEHFFAFPDTVILHHIEYSDENTPSFSTKTIYGKEKTEKKAILYEHLSFPMKFKGKYSKVYIGLTSIPPFSFNMKMYEPGKFIGHVSRLQLILGLYYGMLAVLVIYSFFNYLAVRNKNYLFYGLYIASVGIMLFFMDGKGLRYFFSGDSYPSYINNVTTTLSMFFAYLYTINFLQTKYYTPRFHKVLIVMVFIVLLQTAFTFVLPLNVSTFLMRLLPIPVILLALIAGVLVAKKGYYPARIFLLGFGVFGLGGIIFDLAIEGFIVHNALTIYSINIGSALESIILVFGLSQEMALLKREKQKAQLETIEQLKRNEEIQRQANLELEVKVKERTAEIENQKLLIEEKNKDITDSILYAQRIQQAILPGSEEMRTILRDHFVLYLPKDIVSGDFYWVNEIGGKSLVAAVDCTGHGVPGAFVSLFGYNALNQASNESKLHRPSLILDEIEKLIKSSFNREGNKGIKDGMDMAICSINWKEAELETASAMNPVFVVRKNELILLKGDRFSIGGDHMEKKSFSHNMIRLEQDDMIYLFSDGFADQFGGERGKKFMMNRFKDLLVNLSTKTCERQKEELEKTFRDWSGRHSQVDDILVIGIRYQFTDP